MRIGFIGNPAQLPVGSRDNTGNIIHGHAARNLFSSWKQVSTDSSPENIAAVRDSVTHIGMVAATMLHTRKPPKYADAHGRAADFIEAAKLPVVTFGFGCHAMLDDTVAAANVDAQSVRLLRVIADHADTVGVRGTFTADLCAKYGVKNVTVVGCQSAYVAAMLNLDSPTLSTKGERPVVNVSLGPEEWPVLRLAMKAGAGIIGQGDLTEERLAKGEVSREDFVNPANEYPLSPYVQRSLAAGRLTRGDYYDYIRAHFAKFYAVPEWRTHIADHFDFCVGTRFHGNMVALQAGVPSLWLVHDMRTKELCEHLSLPSVPHARVTEISDLRDLAPACSYDAFWANMPARTREFVAYLEGNGVASLLAPASRDAFTRIMAAA
jgi:hypothetical protein